MVFTGKSKAEFCQRLSTDWRSLANLINIPGHDIDKFAQGVEADGIWRWLESHGKLRELPELLRDETLGRGDLADCLISDAGDSHSGNLLGTEDYGWLAALVDKIEQTQKVFELLEKTPKQSAFIVVGEAKDWPDAVAYRLAYELCGEKRSRPRKILWKPDAVIRGKEAGNLLCSLVSGALITQDDCRELNLEGIRCCLIGEPQPIVFWLKINHAVFPIKWQLLHDIIQCWEEQIARQVSVNHVLMVTIEAKVENAANEKPARPWLKLPFGKKRSTCQASLEADLHRHKLSEKILPSLDKPMEAHVNFWKEECLPPYLLKRFEKATSSLFKEQPQLPHYELQQKLVEILSAP